MSEAVATSFPAALRACMEAGCGRDIDSRDYSEPWSQQALAEQIGVSDRLIRKWLKGDSQPTLDNFDQLLVVMKPKPDPRQQAAYVLLKASRPKPRITRPKPRQSATTALAPLPPISPDARPYRGLEAFREEDAHLFFGRDALAQNVLAKLDHHRLVLLMGASGSGKSSLINAGILPKLRQDQDLTIVRCTPGDRAIANLAAALARAIEPDRSPADLLPAQHTYRDQLQADPEAIRDIAQLLPKGRLFLVIDQFEESFTLTRPANPRQHEALIATLLAIARSPDERRLNALLGMRSDFQNELETADPELIQRLDNAMVQMRAMLPAEREAAITEPARAYGVGLEPGLLTAITADLADNRDALPLLEVALDELWSRRDDTRRYLTLAAFTEIGGISGALGQRADRALEHLGLDETLVRRLFLDLVCVDPDGAATKSTRRPRTKTELDALDPDFWHLGQKLAAPKIRLLVTRHNETNGEETLDITHESLFRQWQRLADWIEEGRNFLLFAQRLDQRLAEFTASGENPDYLLSKTEIDTAQAWQNDGKTFRPDQQAYIRKSAASWAAYAADNVARALWGRLELLFGEGQNMPEHDRDALATLSDAEGDTRQRFLLLAITNPDAARKFNRGSSAVLRAALLLDPTDAIELAVPVLASTPDSIAVEMGLAQVTLARHLAPLTTNSPARTVARALDLAEKTTDPDRLQGLAEAIAVLADKLDSETICEAAVRIIARALNLAGKTVDRFQLQALAAAIAALSDKVDPETISGSVDRTVTSVLDLAETTPSRVRVLVLAGAMASMADLLDPQAAKRISARALALTEETAEPDQLLTLARVISVLVEQPVPEAVKRTVARALNLAEKSTDADCIQALTLAMGSLFDKLDRETAKHTVSRALSLTEKLTDADQFHVLTQAMAFLADKLDPQAAKSAVARALDLAEKTTDAYPLQALAEAITVLADKLDPETIREAAGRIIARALDLAGKAVNRLRLQVLTAAIAALTQRLAVTPILVAAIGIMKLPLGGDEEVTKILLRAITTALDRPDLLRPFPEQSFWAVMQHLAELKAANPDWDWLDLARPPLPPDELVATFRRLCADPPDWPAPAAT